MVCRVEGEGGRRKKRRENLQRREQRDGPPCSSAGALSPPRCVCHQPFLQDKKNEKKEGEVGGGGDVGCEELGEGDEEENARRKRGDTVCWCGLVRRRLVAHFLQS
jgi:hypothetical protein